MNRNRETYFAVTGRYRSSTEPQGWARSLSLVVAQVGSVAGAARELGVPRRTLRRWLAGEGVPDAGRRRQVERTASQIVRRARLTGKREQKIRRATSITIESVDRYDGEEREVTFRRGGGSTGLLPDTFDRLVDAYLAGGDGTDSGMISAETGLFSQVARRMTDDWYRDFYSSTAPDWGTDVLRVRIA